MRFLKFCWLLCLLILWAGDLISQVLPPEFLCVRNDTLRWTPVLNTCGTFQSYEVWSSPTRSGPYVLTATISNLASTGFAYNNPGKQPRYFYLKSNYNCPGEPVINSDTLDNLPPSQVDVERVTVDKGKSLIQWKRNPSPDILGYIIYKVTPLGTLPIDTVYSPLTEFKDVNGDPTSKEETFFVLAMDNCGNTSLFDKAQKSIFVKISIDSCARTGTLEWTPYINWPNGVEDQEVLMSLDNGPFLLIDTVSASTSQYLISNLNDRTSYCFAIKNTESITGISSTSNVFCLTPNVVLPSSFTWPLFATVVADGQIGVSWVWDTIADITGVQLTRFNQSASPSTVNYSISKPLSFVGSALDPFVTDQGPVYYTIKGIDPCNTSVLSDTVSTVFLGGQSVRQFVNRLSWIPPKLPYLRVKRYLIYRGTEGGAFTLLTTSSADSTAFTDFINSGQLGSEALCYYIEAELERKPNVLVPLSVARAKSNTLCIDQISTVGLPSGFIPGGITPTYRAVINYPAGLKNYQLSIFDRWGKIIFETSDPFAGWDGRLGSQDLPQGTYLARVIYQVNTGPQQTLNQPFVLVR